MSAEEEPLKHVLCKVSIFHAPKTLTDTFVWKKSYI